MKIGIHFKPNYVFIAVRDSLHYSFNIQTKISKSVWLLAIYNFIYRCSFRCCFDILFIVWSWIPHESTKEPHNLNMVFLRMLTSQTREGIDAAEANREHPATEHFRTLLVALVQETTLRSLHLSQRRIDLLMGRLRLTVRYPNAPKCEWQSYQSRNDKAKIPDCRRTRFRTIRRFPQPTPCNPQPTPETSLGQLWKSQAKAPSSSKIQPAPYHIGMFLYVFNHVRFYFHYFSQTH